MSPPEQPGKPSGDLDIVVTCAVGLEELLEGELKELGAQDLERGSASVTFRGGWPEVWRANWRLRTANRVLVRLATWNGHDGDALAAGARNLVRRRSYRWGGIDAGALFNPNQTFALRASTRASKVTDTRWISLKVKDGLVDGQRDRFGTRASVDRQEPDLYFRIWLYKNQATLLLDTTGEPLDRRGYRLQTVDAPVREQLAAAAILASGWDGQGPVVDPMCGSGTLLAEAAWIALGKAPGSLRKSWAFERLPGFKPTIFEKIKAEPMPAPGPDVKLYGVDRSGQAINAASRNLTAAGLIDRAHLQEGDAYQFEPPQGPGLVAINPAYGERLEEEAEQWKRLGDLLKNKYKGWRAVILAGGPTRGKHLGLRPSRRLPFRNGPLDARILVLELY